MNDKNKDDLKLELEPDEQAGSESFVKRISKFSALLYLVLAITVVVVATVGIFSISYDYDTSIPRISFPEFDAGEISFPAPVTPPDTESSHAPANNEQSNVDAEIIPPSPVFFCPVKNPAIIKSYSMDALVFSETMKDYRVHSGIDISAAVGSEVMAFGDGTVLSVEDDYFFGTTVAIQHQHGLVSYYMNLDPVLSEGVAVGTELKAGQVFARIGTTARAEQNEPPHLHFELRVNGELVDPEPELGALMSQ